MNRIALVRARTITLSIAALLALVSAPLLSQGQSASSVSISELSPTSASSGSASLELLVRGAGFARNSQVRINGRQRSTSFASANELRAQLVASDLASPASLAVTVFTPSRGSTRSLTLTILDGSPPPVAPDNEAPALLTPPAITLTATSASGAVATFTATARDNSGTATVTCQPPSGTLFPIGMTLVTCTARDASGNTISGTFAVTVTPPADTELPRLELYGSHTYPATSESGVGVSFRAPFATDNSGSVTVTCNPAADVAHTFPIGTTPVVCTARDPSGNTASLTFTITVTPLPAMAITQLDPPNATPGALGFWLSVRGSGFASGMVLRWNGVNRPAQFFNSGLFATQIQTGEIVTAGTVSIAVFDPANNTQSAPATFYIDASRNGVPRITALDATNSPAGRETRIPVNGEGFVPGTVFRWNGTDLPAAAVTFTQSRLLSALVPASMAGTPGTYRVTVFNPGPNAGESNAVQYTLTPP